MKWFLTLGAAVVAFPVIVFAFFYLAPRIGYSAIDKGVSEQYYAKKGEVFFVRMGNFFQLGANKIEGADLESFTVLSEDYAKDSRRAYWKGEPIDDANPDSFSVISMAHISHQETYFAKDNEHVYSYGQLLVGANPANFSLINTIYAHDERNVFYFDQMIASFSADFKTFTGEESDRYLAIRDEVFCDGEVLKGASPNKFELLVDGYSKDHRYVFYRGEALNNAHAPSFQILNHAVQFDQNGVLYNDEYLPFGDVASVKDVDGYFWKDKDGVYYLGSRLVGLAPEKMTRHLAKELQSYQYIELSLDAFNSRYVKRSDVTPLNDSYFIFEGRIYFGLRSIEGSDANDYQLLGHNSYGQHLLSNNTIFFGEKPIIGADIPTFKVIEKGYSLDANHVYWQTHKIYGVHPDQFVYSEFLELEEDDQGRYHYPQNDSRF
ncbi:hypothetical protein DU002_18305 [Corallincola holothuriorum]|uniref:DKNYY family protein n=1 Tax=Corallincola holothuriorum TaxID=2282215 RepID=A0A368N166_9GAMM|nr:DKNYY domain-containing protein [Corallincola holothuriorum]RCU43833.1 hypothetical protein DU002_18305 [Corallincola holothuriorum]